MRWVWRAESGGATLEYAAVFAVVAVVATALIALGTPTLSQQVASGVDSLICTAFSQDDCDPGEADGETGDGADEEDAGDEADEPGPLQEDGDSESGDEDSSDDDPDAEDPESEDEGSEDLDEDALLELLAAEDELIAAEAAIAEAGEDEDSIYEQLLELLWEITGGADIQRCFTEGDIGSCIMGFLSVIPWTKLFSVGAKIPKAWRLFDRWRDARRTRNLRNTNLTNANSRITAARNACRTASSFVPGTPVLLADGTYRAIDEIGLGDEVLAFDPLTGEEGPREVTELLGSDGSKTLVEVEITLLGGDTDTVVATDNHPFWSPELAEWVDAGDLDPGMRLRASSGDWSEVTAVDSWSVPDQQVHNLTIADLNTYYVLADDTPVLVHNASGCGVSSVISEDSLLVKAAEKAGRNQRVQDEMNDLVVQYLKGNKNPGLGNGSLPGTGVLYLRGRNGGRVFFRTKSDGTMEIVGKADKSNESQVISRLNDKYG